MPRYQDPNFNKDQYWLDKQASPADKKAARQANRMAPFHATVDWPRKPPSKKAVIKNTKRARKHITYAS